VTGRAPTRLLSALQRTADVLRELGRPFALVGGLAVSIRVEPRFTRDIDLVVAISDDAAAERLVADLQARGFALQLSLEQRAMGRLAAVRMTPPKEPEAGVVVDLLFASSGIEADICADAEVMEITVGIAIPVATAGHLLVMKVLSRSAERLQDETDLRALLRVLTKDDRPRAIAAAAQIERIGANRGKPLRAEVQAILETRE
jgi:hypothetical protein